VQTAQSVWRNAEFYLGALAIVILLGSGSERLSAQQRGPTDAATTSSPARGIIRAVEQASISTELATRASAIHFREGEAFKKGDTLLEFDCRRQRAGLAAAEAQQLEMQLTLDKFRLLQRAQSVGKNDLEVAEARVAKAAAESEGLRSQLDQCAVIAPFDGRILEIALQRFETAQPGKPFLGIISNRRPELDLIVPSDWARWIKLGEPFQFFIDELGVAVDAEVARISASVDPISQTIKLSATFKRETAGALPGMSGTAHFAQVGR
jgi:membrane fusion protein, multidrug efflux system